MTNTIFKYRRYRYRYFQTMYRSIQIPILFGGMYRRYRYRYIYRYIFTELDQLLIVILVRIECEVTIHQKCTFKIVIIQSMAFRQLQILLCTKSRKTTPACQLPSDVCTAPVMCCTCPTLYSYMLRRRLASFWKIRRCYFSAAHARVSVSISIFRIKSIGRYRYSFYLQKCIGDTDSIGIGIGICVGRYRYVICLPRVLQISVFHILE